MLVRLLLTFMENEMSGGTVQQVSSCHRVPRENKEEEVKAVKLMAGEFIGTFMMCFFGIGAVAVTSLFGAMNGPFQVGMI